MNVPFALLGLFFLFVFVITAAGVLPHVGHKKSVRASSIVQIIFYVRPFEINDDILRAQKLYMFRNMN